MASSASALLKIEKQADGENDSTWGAKIRQNLDVIEEAIAGQVTVSTDQDNTLDDTQYVSNESRKAVINCTATLTANRNVIVPARTKLYVVRNNTSGAYTLTVKTAAGTGIAVTQGEIAWLFCDGTNVIKILATDDFGSLSNVVEDTTPQLGGDLDANGFNILMDDATGINDDSDNELIRFQKTASAVNQIDITNAATGDAPNIAATGDDTDINLTMTPKGAGRLKESSNNVLNAGTTDQLTKGFHSTVHDYGTQSSGTLTVDLREEGVAKARMEGSFTLAPDASRYGSQMITLTTDSTGSYTLTTSGWDAVIGSFDNSADKVHQLVCTIDDVRSVLRIVDVT